MISVVLADDHTVVRNALRLLLDSADGIEVVAEAGNADDAVRYVMGHRPDVLVLDINMPGGSGLEAMPRLEEVSPETRILFLTMQEDPAFAREALARGAAGYVLKDAADTELVEAIAKVAGGATYVQSSLGAKLAAGEDDLNAAQLTRRELDVLRLIALGYTNAEIATELFLSVRTVETHRSNIQSKVGETKRSALVRYAIDHGLTKESSP